MSVSPPRDEDPPVITGPGAEGAHVVEPLLCPRCATPYDLDQEYCLECGLRLPVPATGVVADLGGAWRRRFGWYPGDWLWPSLLALAIAIAGGVGAALLGRDDGKAGPDRVVHTHATPAPPTTTPQRPQATTGRGRTATTPTSTRRQQRPPAPPPRRAGLIAWPAGKAAWTVFLSSSVTRSAALSSAHKALQAGFQNVGIVDSSRYSSLHPGYFEVFTGMYDSQADTGSAIASAHSKGFLSAYPRRVAP